MTRIGLIGAGFMGSKHAQAYTCIQGAEIVCVVDQNLDRAQKLARDVGSMASCDPEVVFQDPSIEVVDITLPTPFHPQFALRGFAAEKHIIIEKPLALTQADAAAIAWAAERSGKFLMVAHVVRFWPEYMAVMRVIRSGQLGGPLQATAYRLSNMPQWANWFKDPAAFGGAVHDLQIHDLDFMNLIFGVPKQVTAMGLKDETGGWNHVVSQLRYASGQASVEAGCMMPQDFPFTAGLRVICEKGVIEYHFRAGGASFEQGQPFTYLLLHQPGRPCQTIPFEPGDGYYNELDYFLQCIKTGTRPSRVTPADACLAIQTALASRESLERSETVTL